MDTFYSFLGSMLHDINRIICYLCTLNITVQEHNSLVIVVHVINMHGERLCCIKLVVIGIKLVITLYLA